MSTPIRLIARLDIKNNTVIKGIQLEGLRVVGDPKALSIKYYNQGIDEIIYIDVVASLYGRNNLTDIICYAAENIFVPITVGGGIRSMTDITKLLNSGADRVAMNTAAIKNPNLLKEASHYFGSQSIVLSIEAKKNEDSSHWVAFYDNGRERSELDVVEWAKQGEELGAGEILLTSVDKEGRREGFDIELVKAVTSAVDIPVIASGGFGKYEDINEVVHVGQASAIAIADGFHYERFNVSDIRCSAKNNKIYVREL